MSYDKTTIMGGKEIWREETVRVDSGGYNLDMTGLKEGDVVEKGTPLIVDFDKRTAKVAKGADEAKANRLLYASVKVEKKVKLWERSPENGFAKVTEYEWCLHGCTGLSDYAEIPDDWK